MTVLSRGARVRRGGRRPGWVLLTALLVLAMGASSALVFTNQVELLKLAVILALWAAVAGAFVSVLYRRQSDADQSRVRDLKLVYDLQLDREIAARREYELMVESQLRRELASELRAQAADEVAALRAELTALRTNLEILFDTDLQHRPALAGAETPQTEAAPPTRAYSDWARDGQSKPVDWVPSDRVTSARQDRQDRVPNRTDDTSIIDVPEEPLLPPRGPATPQERMRPHFEAPPAQPDLRFEPRHRPPPSAPPPEQLQPQMQDWQPVTANEHWLPPGSADSTWAGVESATASVAAPSGRRRRARHSSPDDVVAGLPGEAGTEQQYSGSGRRARSRHSAEYREYSIENIAVKGIPSSQPPAPAGPAFSEQPPRLASPPEPVPRHRGADPSADEVKGRDLAAGGQSVADLMARLGAEPTGGGRRRKREGRDA
ncbi:DUF6779 domain-containing protein [Mycobacterium haemophilum]|uniref:Membrane protein n=1 Tax=Mycobacterium haemophilum TaxID=29311 RepID=A0A0I9YJW6_9MYCO|nr:DUF6779 domain-containing protein [Mycobacterium haemophilum]KLO26540.1 membrane protein [Mycobacterium haemophilum]KLO34714.1 membrane protein [Mycobacterium haemophilum]KLO40397.1 membrane protein [Mycobacterium haemophilum]KLO47890.1 membrane protein [Mycobacterium haemophilum]